MNFRFFDYLVGSAPRASQEFRSREKHSAKHYSAKTIEKYFENFHKILKIFQNISKIFSKS